MNNYFVSEDVAVEVAVVDRKVPTIKLDDAAFKINEFFMKNKENE